MPHVMVTLPLPIWRSVRSVLAYEIPRLKRKAARSNSATSAQYDCERAENLKVALEAIRDELYRVEAE